MVYIRLAESLYQRLKGLLPESEVVGCGGESYLAYPIFKRIAQQYGMELHREIGRGDILTYGQLEEKLEVERQSPQQKRLVAELKHKREVRMMGRLRGTMSERDYYFEKEGEGNSVKDMTDTISFSMTFIFTFFMAGLTGYYVGAYFLGLPLAHSLMLALGFIIVTIVVETGLFILKQQKKEMRNKKKSYRDQYDREEAETVTGNGTTKSGGSKRKKE